MGRAPRQSPTRLVKISRKDVMKTVALFTALRLPNFARAAQTVAERGMWRSIGIDLSRTVTGIVGTLRGLVGTTMAITESTEILAKGLPFRMDVAMSLVSVFAFLALLVFYKSNFKVEISFGVGKISFQRNSATAGPVALSNSDRKAQMFTAAIAQIGQLPPEQRATALLQMLDHGISGRTAELAAAAEHVLSGGRGDRPQQRRADIVNITHPAPRRTASVVRRRTTSVVQRRPASSVGRRRTASVGRRRPASSGGSYYTASSNLENTANSASSSKTRR